MLDRRTLLQRFGAAAGLAAFAPALGSSAGWTAERRRAVPLRQPDVRASSGGELATQLRVAFAESRIDGLPRPVDLRNYEGGIPGPTLRVRPGDTLRLTQINALPPNPDQHLGENHDINIPHHFNTFNLHTHGLHVDPGGDADNVFRAFPPRDAAHGLEQDTYVSEIHIPDDHEAGTFWYHPHQHGAATVQLSSGMAGVLIVEGAVDDVPEIAAADDIVVCINELKLDERGQVPDFNHPDALFNTPSTFLVNGELNPTIHMQPGQVHRWRLLNAGAFSSVDVSLEGHALHQIAQDGLTFGDPITKQSVNLAMGNRADVMVRADKPGQYQMRAGDVVLMTLVVEGNSLAMRLPAELPGTPTLAPIGPDDLTPTGPHGDGTREIIFQTDENVLPGTFTTAYRTLGDGATPSSDPAHPTDPADPRYGRFDPEFVNHTLRVGDVEEWTIINKFPHDHSEHPFHLHTNPFLVISLDGQELSPPVWHDTINPMERAVIRFRVGEFTGKTVAHCHNIEHEDLGMMQVVEYLPKPTAGIGLNVDLDLL